MYNKKKVLTEIKFTKTLKTGIFIRMKNLTWKQVVQKWKILNKQKNQDKNQSSKSLCCLSSVRAFFNKLHQYCLSTNICQDPKVPWKTYLHLLLQLSQRQTSVSCIIGNNGKESQFILGVPKRIYCFLKNHLYVFF